MFSRRGISCHAGRAISHFKLPETGNLDRIARNDRRLNVIEKAVDELNGIFARKSEAFRRRAHEILFIHRFLSCEKAVTGMTKSSAVLATKC